MVGFAVWCVVSRTGTRFDVVLHIIAAIVRWLTDLQTGGGLRALLCCCCCCCTLTPLTSRRYSW